MKSFILFACFGALSACVSPRVTAERAPASLPTGLNSTDPQLSTTYPRHCEEGLAAVKARLTALETRTGPATVDSVLVPLNDMLMAIDQGASIAGLYASVHPNKEVRDAADTCEKDYSKVITELWLSRPLYEAIGRVDVSGEDRVTERYVTHLLRDFRRSGVDKDEATRKRVLELEEELVEIGQLFGKNIRNSVNSIELPSVDSLAGLPQDYIEAHTPGADGKITVTTNYPDYIPFITYAKSDALRLALYKAFRQRGYPGNEAVLKELLARRHELATLLGYTSFANYITEDKMIKSEVAADDFIERIAALSEGRAAEDYRELLGRLQVEFPDAVEVGDWQKSYVKELVKKENYQLDSQAIRTYFTYNKVRQGVFDITSRMFGVKYVPVEDSFAWHADVETYEMVDEASGEVLGRFHLDMHPREAKYKHAAAFPVQTGVEGRQVPMAALVCNFPRADEPMEHAQVETFFHEFGHLIHHLFAGKHRWVGVSGFNTEWDFVEAPSQMLEEWAWDAESLKTFASDAKGNTIPDQLIEKMNRARGFGKGLDVAHQMFYAALSLNYYNRSPASFEPTELMKELQAKYSPFSYVDDTYFQYSFGHLDGYSAIYYTYMWSLVISKDLFSVFEKEGLFDRETARRYRELVLAPGGSKDASEMVKDFLSRDYSFEAFSRWLNAGKLTVLGEAANSSDND